MHLQSRDRRRRPLVVRGRLSRRSGRAPGRFGGPDPSSHHSEECERPWHVIAVDLRSRTLRKEYVEATGWTEAEALRELAALLGGWHVEEVEAQFS